MEVRAGQVLRIVALDGPQVADSTFLALDNPREGYHAGQTVAPSTCWPAPDRCAGSPHCGLDPPYERPMMTVIDDPVGVHFAWNGGRCSAGVYAVRDGIDSGHRTCQGQSRGGGQALGASTPT